LSIFSPKNPPSFRVENKIKIHVAVATSKLAVGTRAHIDKAKPHTYVGLGLILNHPTLL
jgi:hypothetical protein